MNQNYTEDFMKKAYIVTLGLLVSFSSFANFKIETLNVKETGKDL